MKWGRRSVAWHFLQTKTGDESDREWTKSSGGGSDGSRRAQTASVSRESGYLKVAETALQCKHRTDDGRTNGARPPLCSSLHCRPILLSQQIPYNRFRGCPIHRPSVNNQPATSRRGPASRPPRLFPPVSSSNDLIAWTCFCRPLCQGSRYAGENGAKTARPQFSSLVGSSQAGVNRPQWANNVATAAYFPVLPASEHAPVAC